MPYKPLQGWIVTVKDANGKVFNASFHADELCSVREAAKFRERVVTPRSKRTVNIDGPYLYADVRSKSLHVCKCAGGQNPHAAELGRHPGTVFAGSQGTGKRR